MKTNILTTILLAGLGVAVSAQDQGEQRGGRERWQRSPERMLGRIAEDLGLNDEQRVLWDERIAGQQAQMDQWRGQMRELRQARRDGDETRATELEQQMNTDGWNPMDSLQQSLEAIKPTLDADQLQRHSDLTERFQRRREALAAGGAEGRGGGGRRGADRMLDRVAGSLELSEEQRAEFEEITGRHRERMQEAWPLSRELRRAQRDGDTQRAEELRAQLQELGVEPQESLGQAMDELESILEGEQTERYSEMRRTMERRNQSREFYREAESELPDALNMDQAQRTQYNDRLRDLREAWRAQSDVTRAIRREMREAREAGDETRLEELQMELEMSQRDPADQRAEFLDDLKGMLREDQRPLLQRFYPNVGVVGTTRHDDVRNILRAALRTGLDRAQRAKWRVIMREAMKSIHQLRTKGKDAESAIAVETRGKVEGLLTDVQRARFEKELKRLRSSKTRR